LSFYPDELERIENAELVLLGINPSEIDGMSLQLRADVFAIHNAKTALQNGKMPT